MAIHAVAAVCLASTLADYCNPKVKSLGPNVACILLWEYAIQSSAWKIPKTRVPEQPWMKLPISSRLCRANARI